MTLKTILNKLAFPLIKIMDTKDEFIFDYKAYQYFMHENSWNTERIIEIPIIKSYIERFEGRRILEFGNVLQQYIKIPKFYTIVDKYSEGKNVTHCDIVDFNPTVKYNLIVSISTLEHVGYNEEVEVTGHTDEICDIKKIRIALDNMKTNCLKEKGLMIFTMPLGYNKLMDGELFLDSLGFDKVLFMKRITKSNIWKEITRKDIVLKDIIYGYPFNNANYICICFYENT